MNIREELLLKKNEKNAAFQAKLTPTLPKEVFLGWKVPELRGFEKEKRNTNEMLKFVNELPHRYYDENMLHSIYVSNIQNDEEAMEKVEAFLPYVDNWAVCDTLRFKAIRNDENLIEKIRKWILSKHVYTCRFGMEMLMTYFLDEKFKRDYLEFPSNVHSSEYYVNMMIAWFFATALAKQWNDTIPYIEEKRLSKWVHNKTIQKACESYRITKEQKELLKKLKIKD